MIIDFTHLVGIWMNIIIKIDKIWLYNKLKMNFKKSLSFCTLK